MTPEEAKTYVTTEATIENWKRVQFEGKYYRLITIRRGEGKDTFSMSQYVDDLDSEKMEKFWVDAATNLKQMIDNGIVK
jgi:hypothetical protein